MLIFLVSANFPFKIKRTKEKNTIGKKKILIIINIEILNEYMGHYINYCINLLH